MKVAESVKEVLSELRQIEFENEVGKASTYYGFGLIVLVGATSFFAEAMLWENIKIGGDLNPNYFLGIIAFFFVDMILAYHYIES